MGRRSVTTISIKHPEWCPVDEVTTGCPYWFGAEKISAETRDTRSKRATYAVETFLQQSKSVGLEDRPCQRVKPRPDCVLRTCFDQYYCDQTERNNRAPRENSASVRHELSIKSRNMRLSYLPGYSAVSRSDLIDIWKSIESI